MTVLEERYQISEQVPSAIGAHWKVLHILLLIIIVLCGFITCFSFENVFSGFNNFCIFDADIVFTNTSFIYPDLSVYIEDKQLSKAYLKALYNETDPDDEDLDELRAISLFHTIWGDIEVCGFVQFTPLMSALFAIVWCVFFIMLSRGGSGTDKDILPHPWRIVLPCLVFSIIFSIVLTASTIKMKEDFNEFCSQFSSELNQTECNPGIDQWTIQFQPEIQPFFQYYQTTKISAYIGLCGWFLQIFLLILRILVVSDFKIEFVQIRDKDEEELKVINLNGEQQV